MKKSLLLWSMILFPTIGLTHELKLLTWNTFLLPPPINFSLQKSRTKQMSEILPKLEHDVMFFQEAFYDGLRRRLIQALKPTHPYIIVPKKGKKLWHFQDSGLFIASKFPLKLLEVQVFDDCAKADCFSSKSALLVETTLKDGKAIQFVNTHMQAWDEPKTYAIRRKQLQIIKEMLARHARDGVAQILVGDLNIDGKISIEYPGSLALLEMHSAPLVGELDASNGFSTQGCFKRPGDESDPSQWLDHFWIKDSSGSAQIIERRVHPMLGNLNNRVCPLSDHHAVEATLKL